MSDRGGPLFQHFIDHKGGNMSKVFVLLSLIFISLVMVEGLISIYLYITAPPDYGSYGSTAEARELHYFIWGGIFWTIGGLFGTPILSFILYKLLRNMEWFKKLQDNLKYSITILLIIFVTVTATYLVHTEYKKWKENQKYEQRLTAEDIKMKWFSNPAYFNTAMKDVNISKVGGQVYIQMDYDEQAAIQRKLKDVRSEFQRDLLNLIGGKVFDMSPYKELKTLSVQVRYKNEWYEFDQIPLKDERSQPFTTENKEVKKIISDKMKISPSSTSNG
jgi:hypothetical protein